MNLQFQKQQSLHAYNHLNLPRQITFGPEDNIQYAYTGAKLRKTLTPMKTTSGNVTDYCGNFFYNDNQLITIFAGEVRVAPVNVGNSTFWKYEYSMKDHTSTKLSARLGNTRVVFAAHSHGQPELLQQTSYYPFGITMQLQNFSTQTATENKYLYNSKELQDDQLAGNTLDWYDYGARFYDATQGRWHVVDPLAEKYPSESFYAYVANNSINAIDPDGRYIIFIGGLRLWYAARDQEGSRNNEWGGKTGIYNNDVFNYWSTNENTYGRAANISQYYQDKYNDNLGIQYCHENDQVSSRNYLPNGGTKFGKINGINNENFHHGNIMGGKGQPRANIFTRGGHTVTDNDQFIKKGE